MSDQPTPPPEPPHSTNTPVSILKWIDALIVSLRNAVRDLVTSKKKDGQ